MSSKKCHVISTQRMRIKAAVLPELKRQGEQICHRCCSGPFRKLQVQKPNLNAFSLQH